MLPRRGALLVSGALVLGVVLVYAPVRSFDFVSFDDPQYVTDNPAVESGLSAESLVWALRPQVARAGLEHQHVEPVGGELLRHHRATAARADYDHVAHQWCLAWRLMW